MWERRRIRYPIVVGYLKKHDPQAVQSWLTPLVQRNNISAIGTDDIFNYCVVADKLGTSGMPVLSPELGRTKLA